MTRLRHMRSFSWCPMFWSYVVYHDVVFCPVKANELVRTPQGGVCIVEDTQFWITKSNIHGYHAIPVYCRVQERVQFHYHSNVLIASIAIIELHEQSCDTGLVHDNAKALSHYRSRSSNILYKVACYSPTETNCTVVILDGTLPHGTSAVPKRLSVGP